MTSTSHTTKVLVATLPVEFATVMLAFADLFSKRTFKCVQLLVVGAILAPGKRTITAILRVMGLSQEKHFQQLNRVLNRTVWSNRAVSQVLLQMLVGVFAPQGPLVMGLDDTIERRHLRKSKRKVFIVTQYVLVTVTLLKPADCVGWQ